MIPPRQFSIPCENYSRSAARSEMARMRMPKTAIVVAVEGRLTTCHHILEWQLRATSNARLMCNPVSPFSVAKCDWIMLYALLKVSVV